MSVILKFFGGAVVLVSLLAFLLAMLGLLGVFRSWSAQGESGAGLYALATGGVAALLYCAGGMAVGAICFVGGRALDHMNASRRPGPRTRSAPSMRRTIEPSDAVETIGSAAPTPRRRRR